MKRVPYKRALSPCEAKSEFNLLQFLTTTTAFRLQEPSKEKPGTINDHELFNSYQYKDVNEIAKDLTHTQNDSPEIIKEAEYIFEHLDELNRCARLIIFRRPFCETFFGTLINGKNADCKTPE